MCYKSTFETSNHISFWKTLHRTYTFRIKTNKKSKTSAEKNIVYVMFTFYRHFWLVEENVIIDS